MNPSFPVYVISKSRHDKCLTARELSSMNVPFKLVVEPHQQKDYKQKWGNTCEILSLPFKDLGQGSIPARNWVWDNSISNGHSHHWILDDNIEGFHRLNRNEKYKVCDGTIFRCCEDFTLRYKNVGLSGMNYHSFCKANDPVPAFYKNTRIYSCILIDNSLPFRWRGRYNEDTDLSLRVLKSGLCTILFNAFLCGKVTTQRMRGGNTDHVYTDGDKRLKFAESLKNQHPDIVRVVEKFGRFHHQVDYSQFKKTRLQYREGIKQIEKVNNYGMRLIHNG